MPAPNIMATLRQGPPIVREFEFHEFQKLYKITILANFKTASEFYYFILFTFLTFNAPV